MGSVGWGATPVVRRVCRPAKCGTRTSRAGVDAYPTYRPEAPDSTRSVTCSEIHVRDADRIRADFIRRNLEQAQLLAGAARAEFDRGIRAQRVAEALRILTAFQPYLDWHRTSVPTEECAEFEAKIKKLNDNLRSTGRSADSGTFSASRHHRPPEPSPTRPLGT